MTETERLAEATALLGRIVKCAREDRATTPGVTRLARALAEAERLLSRAPALPAAPPPVAEMAPCYFCQSTEAERSPCPLCHKCVCQLCAEAEGESCCDEQPAAPEPSAGQGVGLEQLWEGWRSKALSAEAQLAAVLQVCVMAEESEYRGGSLHALRRIRALLTPAPSPGAGEKT